MVRRSAYEVAADVVDPELPDLTIADLGILREVSDIDGRIVVTIAPTYSGCPALTEIRRDVQGRLHDAGYPDVELRTSLDPPWSSDWITPEGRSKLSAAGIAPPGSAPTSVMLSLQPPTPVACPRCGSPDTVERSRFGATACRSHHQCAECGEPFDAVKAI